MRKIIFIGRSEAGKTTLTQAMKGKKIVYHKTQYINHYHLFIKTSGIILRRFFRLQRKAAGILFVL